MPQILMIAACLYIAICLVFIFFQRSFIYRPTRPHPADVPMLLLEQPGAQVAIAVRPRTGSKALVYFGGNAEDVVGSLAEWEVACPERAIYAMQYRGYGGSSGRPTERSLRSDARALFRIVQTQQPDVMVVGRSLGSSLAIQLAAEEQVSRLVLIAPFESILAIAQRTAPFLPMGLLLRDRYESTRYAHAVTCPTLVLAASDDELVPPGDTHALLAAFPQGVATLKVIENADHNSVSASAVFWQAIQAVSQASE